jgi:hypothetical protein
MSRSFKRTPIGGNTTAESDKKYKRQEHRRARAMTREALSAGQEMPSEKATGSSWNSDKDGKRWYGYREEWMRK